MIYRKYVPPPSNLWEKLFGVKKWSIWVFHQDHISIIANDTGEINNANYPIWIHKKMNGSWTDLTDEQKAQYL